MIALARAHLLRRGCEGLVDHPAPAPVWIAILATKPSRRASRHSVARPPSRFAEIGIRPYRIASTSAALAPIQGKRAGGEAVGVGYNARSLSRLLSEPRSAGRDPRRPRRSRSGDGWRRESCPARRRCARSRSPIAMIFMIPVFEPVFPPRAQRSSRRDARRRCRRQALGWTIPSGHNSITASRSAAVWPDARSLTRTNSRGRFSVLFASRKKSTVTCRAFPPWPKARRNPPDR